MRGVVLAVGCAVVLAGCTVSVPAPGPEDGLDGGGANVEAPSGVTVTVLRVIDGDTAEVRYPNGSTDTVRFIGVDTPETTAENTPGEFPGVPDTDAGAACLREAGEAASAFTAERIEGRRVTLEFDPNLDRRGYYDRLLAYIVVDGTTLNYELVERGHARVYDSPFVERDRYDEAMSDAQQAGSGLWSCADGSYDGDGPGSDGSLRIAAINADAPGNDNDNLDEEYVVIENTAATSIDLEGYTLSDAAGKTYTFPTVTLEPGATITVRSGSGSDGDGTLYWGRDGAVWSNDGDTVTLRTPDGTVVARREY